MYFVAFGLFVMVCVLFANVVLRYVFNSGLTWANEIASYDLAIISFAATPVWVRRRSGLRVDALISLFPVKAQKFVLWLNYIIQGVIFGVLAYGCWQLFIRSIESKAHTHTLEIPLSCIYFTILIFIVDAALRSIQVTIIGVKDFIHKTDNWARAEKFAEHDFEAKAKADAASTIKAYEKEAN